ncbi:lipopolysaccharide biosynthesis protein [Aristaeella lactis]|uniref:Membrane protein involved in the export of O-antigen and teichoic acid n=1 Tax=Aristaeella lactis TaxID=3046383 RepID=A0AC61PJA1_9FIRM|nr:lipopolysaccharide biosynthesis protein [Aristaeella lactis]QUA54038.1 lipopolysaccharide biosynthesis protein [Aristaeella lactis]SMC42657.1 Membrane protein involved in the export of O-antigen and teichoic acid [Aristaeella lactis]
MDNKKLASNFLWRLMERMGAQGVTLIVSLVLARLLEPSVYGIVAYVLVFTTILQVFVDSGLGTALIQKKNADDLDFSSVFYFNIIICFSLYALLFLGAPYISLFYGIDELTPIVRVLGLSLLISGIKCVQQAYVSRYLLFKKFFYATLAGTVGAAIIGITMAYMGFGVWAIVAQNLFNQTIDTIILWITVKWRPKKCFSMRRLKGLFSYGWKLLVARLLSTVYTEIRQLLIGKVYTAADLAFYNRSYEIPAKIVPNIITSINSVLLPTLSKEQDNLSTIKSIARRANKVANFVIWPFLVGLAVCGKALVEVLLTEKWLPCVPYLFIFCADYALWPTIYVYNNVINSIGRSDIYLKLQFIQKGIGMILLFLSIRYGVIWIALTVPIISIIELIISASIIRKLIGYSFTEQLSDVYKPIIFSMIMGAIVWGLSLFELKMVLILVLQFIIGVITYTLLSFIFNRECFMFVKTMIGKLIKK